MADMAFEDELAALKHRLRAAQVPVDAVLSVAGVNRSSWTRWHGGKHVPRADAWHKVKDAAERLLTQRDEAA